MNSDPKTKSKFKHSATDDEDLNESLNTKNQINIITENTNTKNEEHMKAVFNINDEISEYKDKNNINNNNNNFKNNIKN